MEGKPSNGGYLPELDGLRALAILPVLLFHQRVPGFSLGWAGVWLFFVISGFLITGLLLDTKKDPRFFRNFYARRALRIFPIYYLALLGVVMLATWRHWPRRDLPFFLVYLQNYAIAYWGPGVRFPALFNHSWSLAVEEQFYALWPLAVFFLSPSRLLLVCGLSVVSAVAARFLIAAYMTESSLVFMPLLCVIDSLGVGGALAIAHRSEPARQLLRRPLLASTLVVVPLATTVLLLWQRGLAAYWTPDLYLRAASPDLILHTSLAFSFGGVINAALLCTTPLSSLLCLRPLRAIGKVSYGLYIYHYPIFVLLDDFFRHRNIDRGGRPVLIVVQLGATFLLAIVSWQWIEKPILAFKARFSRATSLLAPFQARALP